MIWDSSVTSIITRAKSRRDERLQRQARARSYIAALAFCAIALLGCSLVFAQTEPARPFAAPSVVSSPAPSGIASLGQVTLALGLVLAVIFVAAWLLKRVRGFGRNGAGALDILADLPVGQKERAVLIRVGTTQVLLGVAPGRVTTLHVLPEPIEIPAGTGAPGAGTSHGGAAGLGAGGAERPTFKSVLLKSLGKQ